VVRRAAKVDANQGQIVAALRKLGYTVQTRVDDIFVGGHGHNLWVELKAPGKENDLKPSQEKLRDEWKGAYIVTSDIQDILDWFEERRWNSIA
jgi:hypothetical protein